MKEPTDQELIEKINDYNIWMKEGNNGWDHINNDLYFMTLSIEQYAPVMMITMLRTSYIGRDNIGWYKYAVEKCKEELDKRGLDSSILLRGLL